MSKPSQPIALIVVADEPALFFSSVKVAEGYLEAIDVEDGVYPLAYGPSGELYSISSDGTNVIIEPDSERAPKPEALSRLLADVLAANGFQISEATPLSELLRLCERFVDDW